MRTITPATRPVPYRDLKPGDCFDRTAEIGSRMQTVTCRIDAVTKTDRITPLDTFVYEADVTETVSGKSYRLELPWYYGTAAVHTDPPAADHAGHQED